MSVWDYTLFCVHQGTVTFCGLPDLARARRAAPKGLLLDFNCRKLDKVERKLGGICF